MNQVLIYMGVKSICEIASNKFESDNIEALISLIQSDEFSFKQKNKAIWALGQIGDRRALPLLRKLDTDEKACSGACYSGNCCGGWLAGPQTAWGPRRPWPARRFSCQRCG